MEKRFNSLAGKILMTIAALAFMWSTAGGWLAPSIRTPETASAAALTVQSIGVTPLSKPGTAYTGAQAPKGANSPELPGTAAGTGFTYQGSLKSGGNPASGQYDFLFALFDSVSGGNQVAGPITVTNQTVTAGLFTAPLDFGPSAFYGDARWLEISVRTAGGGNFTTLAPRQPLTAAPYALSTRWQGTSGKPYPYNPVPQPNTLSTVDSSSNVGDYTSIAVGADGLGLVSYLDASYVHLKVAHCSNPECSAATTSTIDPANYTGYYTSLAIGADGLGLIGYQDYANTNVKVAHCSDVVCDSAVTATIDSTGTLGSALSLAIGSDGLGLLAYQDGTNSAVKVAHCSNVTCSSATTATIDNPGNVSATSIAIGADGLALIAYTDGGNTHLKVAHCSNVPCTSATITTYDAPYYAQYPSIVLGSDGFGLVTYFGYGDGFQRLKAMHCTNVACSTGTVSVVDPATSVQYQTSVTVGPDGLPLISYMDATYADLKVAHCFNVACSAANVVDVDGANWVGDQSSITMGADGLGLIAYRDDTTGHLKVAHCAGPLCLAFQHKR